MAARVRPRSAWEGIDLGFAMARQWFLPLWGLWWLVALPTNLLLALLLIALDYSAAVGVVAWWLKPLYEPSLLFWLSRALFGERPRPPALMRHWIRIVRPQLLANLTWRRFSPSRSFAMPVSLLEGLAGTRRQARLAQLGRRQGAAFWLTLAGLHFEMALELSALVLVVLLVPQELQWLDLGSVFWSPGPLSQWLGYAVGLLAMSLIAPFYVAGGFALYLNRRTELEAWDLELTLRRLAARMKAMPVAAAGSLGCLALTLILSFQPEIAHTAELTPENARERIAEVLRHEDFGRVETVKVLEFRQGGGDTVVSPWDLGDWSRALVETFKGVALAIEILLWGLAGLALFLVGGWMARNRDRLGRALRVPTRASAPTPKRLFGLDLRNAGLPADIAGEARALARDGDARAALGLLYRAALSRLVRDHGAAIRPSATEAECLLLARKQLSAPEADLFQRLTQVWISVAYGHVTPADSTLLQLCSLWQRTYPDGPAH
jgi:hypothetical protein